MTSLHSFYPALFLLRCDENQDFMCWSFSLVLLMAKCQQNENPRSVWWQVEKIPHKQQQSLPLGMDEVSRLSEKQKTHPKHKFDSEWVGKPMQTHENYDANIWISTTRWYWLSIGVSKLVCFHFKLWVLMWCESRPTAAGWRGEIEIYWLISSTEGDFSITFYFIFCTFSTN